MTDTSNWHQFIDRITKTINDESGLNRGEIDETHIVVPLNEYQLGNLLGMLKRIRGNTYKETCFNESCNLYPQPHEHTGSFICGDWFNEILSIIIYTAKKFNLELGSNFGDRFDLENWKKGGFGLHNKK